MTRRRVLGVLGVIALLIVGALLLAPYIYAETWSWRYGPYPPSAEPVKLAKGRMVGDYFAVEHLGDGAYAIGEPRYYQANYSYLIVGTQRALLFDAGSGTRDMKQLVAGLTTLPVTLIPSHLHYDHLGGIAPFDRIAMVDLPSTRADMKDGRFVAGRYQFLGMFDGIATPTFPVAEWIKPDAMIDLGERRLQLLSTPGHTAQSVALWDEQAKRLFTGDFIYPTMLYAFLPGANRADYHRTAKGLLGKLPPDTRLWAAHCCRRDEGYAAPWLTMRDLADLERALGAIDAGTLEKTEGWFPRRYRVNRQMDIGTGLPLINP